MKNNILQFLTDNEYIVLSSKSLFYKTESFIKHTKNCTNIDTLLSKISESIVQNLKDILLNEKQPYQDNSCYLIETSDKKYTFLFKFGFQVSKDLNPYDILFFEHIPNNTLHSNIRIDEYIKANPKLKLILKKDHRLFKTQDFNKLYTISNISGINLPKLDKEQKEIVETIDKNILVQGVAGSGKTNICIDKIIFTACRNFSGKTLYTTYSRGLLVDTKLKVELYKKDLQEILTYHNNGKLKFLDNDHKKALENRLGIYFFSNDDNQIFSKIQKIIDYLTHKVDFLLIEDIYKNKFHNDKKFVKENFFINDYCKNTKNHQIEKCFAKLSQYSKEIIYKEIYGMIFGAYNLSQKNDMLSLEEYTSRRQNSFNKFECETIYQIAQDFKKHCEQNNLIDNNLASREILENISSDWEYSLAIIDEVQDYTQVNLYLFKKLSLKLFCVGDALQMINPSYFNFGYLKNLLYEKDLVDVKVLKSNYRNTKKISSIIDSLSQINKTEFGTHNFVLKGQSIDNGIESTALFVRDNNLNSSIAKKGFEDITFVVANEQQKRDLQKTIKTQEVLTVSEIKGLERTNIITYNLLSSNLEKWKQLKRQKINHKLADENSVYRYYYNLFYVGVSRAKQNLIIYENAIIEQFEQFFVNNLEIVDINTLLEKLDKTISKAEFSQKELCNRAKEFIKLEQFENARFAANKIRDDKTRIDTLRSIEIYENFIRLGKYREAGIKFWEYGMINQAKEQFTLSQDTILIELIDKCSSDSNNDLNIDIIEYFDDVKDNNIAQAFIVETVKKDIAKLKNSFNKIKENFRKGRK